MSKTISDKTYEALKSQIDEKEGKIKETTKKKFQIKSRWTGGVVYESEKTTYKDVVEEAVDKGADLKGAYLEGADLEGAYLKGAYLEGADLKGAYLKGAYLEGADLKGADLEGAYLEGADLKGADLKGADLEGAYLEGADLKGADLEGADLKKADFHRALFFGRTDNDNYKTKIAKSQVNDFLDALGIKVI